jgi:hypothetical protein
VKGGQWQRSARGRSQNEISCYSGAAEAVGLMVGMQWEVIGWDSVREAGE